MSDSALFFGELITPKPHVNYCSFCGKDDKKCSRLVAGPNAFICNVCIDLSHQVIHANASLKFDEVECRLCQQPTNRKAAAPILDGSHICDPCLGLTQSIKSQFDLAALQRLRKAPP